MKKIRKIAKRVFISVFLLALLFAFYSNSLLFVEQKVKGCYSELKSELKKQGYKPNVYVISGKRFRFFNSLLAKYGNAVKNSTHLKGKAIDVIVFDVNKDGKSNNNDVDIVYKILDKQIIKSKGGIGTYKNRKSFFAQQMVHFDCRGYWTRWHK